MARLTPNKGLHVWDLGTDQFNHGELAANWDAVDTALVAPTRQVETLSAVPTLGNFAGRLVMLSTADLAFGLPAWTLIRFDGSSWRSIGYEIQPTVPTSGNFAGRIVVLSVSSGGFNAWDVIRYDGTVWGIIGGFQNINNGAAALNIVGLQSAKDVYISDSARGFVLKDRTTGFTWRLTLNNGALGMEKVT